MMIPNSIFCPKLLCNLQILILPLVWYIFIKVSAQTQYAVKCCQPLTFPHLSSTSQLMAIQSIHLDHLETLESLPFPSTSSPAQNSS